MKAKWYQATLWWSSDYFKLLQDSDINLKKKLEDINCYKDFLHLLSYGVSVVWTQY